MDIIDFIISFNYTKIESNSISAAIVIELRDLMIASWGEERRPIMMNVAEINWSPGSSRSQSAAQRLHLESRV